MKVLLPFLAVILLIAFTTTIHGKDSSHVIYNKESADQRSAIGRAVFILSRSKSGLPAVWDNMNYAINTVGKPSTLTRITDQSLIRQNRRKSGCTTYGSRKSGYNIDEYPFASSAQGGIGAVLREVPISENSRQGALLKAFYEKNGIKNGDSYDVQLVE